MKDCTRFYCVLIAAAFLFSSTSIAPAAAQSAPENLYAELAKLPPKERHERIVEGAKKEGTLNLIEGVGGNLGLNHIKLFEKRYPFVKVQVSQLGTQDAAQRLFSEETAGRHLTDIVSIETPDITKLLAKGMTARYQTPETDRILKQYRDFVDPQHRWVPWIVNEHGIAYNTNLVKQPPKTYSELCDSRFKGTVSMEPAATRFLVGLYYIFDQNIDKVGEWLKCIGKNDPVIQRGYTLRLNLMLSGDHAISPDQYLYNGSARKKKNPSVPFGVDYASKVAIYTQDLVINKNTPHPNAAALYADWSLSDESQRFMAKAYRAPVTAKHPFFPDDAKMVPFNFASDEIVDKLHALWNTYVRTR